MKKLFLSILALFWVIFSAMAQVTINPDNGRVYVDAVKDGDGSSWDNAVKELADVLDAAKTDTGIKEIWVAKGTYKPKYFVTWNESRAVSFVLVKDVKIYGGFAGTESSIDERNFTGNETILSGDIGTSGDNTDNCYHVVLSYNDVGDAVLDGFAITGGYADISKSTAGNNAQYGGGLYIDNSSPILKNLIIRGNYAKSQGGGLFIQNSASDISYVSVINNSTDMSGAGMYFFLSACTLDNVLVDGNICNGVVSMGHGAGIYINANRTDGSFLTIQNSTVSNNEAQGSYAYGGGVYIYSASPLIRNVSVSGNKSGYMGGGVYVATHATLLATLLNVLINENSSGYGGGLCLYGNTLVLNATVANNSANYGGGMYVRSNSRIQNSIIQGNTSINLGYENAYSFINASTSPVWTNTLLGGSGGSANWNVDLMGTDGGNNLDEDAFFADIASGDYSLDAASPAIDAGADALYIGDIHSDTDLAGNARLLGSAIDMGAYEALPSVDATLKNLETDKGTLTPVFTRGTIIYNVNVDYDIEEIEITATANNVNATISGDTGLQTLTVGDNTFIITVTSEDWSATRNYTLSVHRRQLSNDASLSILTVNTGTLTPNFASGTFSYNVAVPYSTTSITFSTTTNHASARVTGDGNRPLVAGDNRFEIAVTAEDGIATQTYTVNVYRAIDVATLNVESIPAQDYTGSAIEPSPEIKDGATILIKGVDYTLSYANNINPGMGTVTITGKGNYGGTKTVSFVINKLSAVAPSSLPEGLEAVYGDRFRDVSLPSGFTWPNPSSTVGNASSSPVSVTALYNPDPSKYEDYIVVLQLTIHPALPPREVIFPMVDGTNEIVYDPEQTLSDIGLINGSGAGAFTWRYPNTVPTVDRTDYPVVFTPADANNYDYSAVEGWDARTRTIIRTISLTIVPRDITIDLVCDAVKTYTGLPMEYCSAEVTISELRSSTAESIALEYLYYRNSLLQDEAINAGVYEVFARSADVNYSGQSAIVTFTIEKAQPLIVLEDQEKAYTGSPIAPDYEITGSHTASGLSRTLTFTYEGVDGTVYGPTETAPTEIGEYKVHAYTPGSVNHLPAEAEALLKIVSGVGIDQVASETFRIYPNPVSKNSKLIIDNGQLTIDNERTFVEVYDTNGTLLRKIEVRDSKTEIRSESKEGVYLYIIRSDKETMPIAKIKVVVK